MLIKEQNERKSLTALNLYNVSFNKHQSINTYSENYAVFIYILILLDLFCSYYFPEH